VSEEKSPNAHASVTRPSLAIFFAARLSSYNLNFYFTNHTCRYKHQDRELQPYRCFINPSTSDVVATTTAEGENNALAFFFFVSSLNHMRC
jgi:hypothetical protein